MSRCNHSGQILDVQDYLSDPGPASEYKLSGTPWEWPLDLVSRILLFGLPSSGGSVQNLITQTQFFVLFAHGLLYFKALDILYSGHGT